MKTFRRSDAGVVDLNEPLVIDICMTCDLYQTLTNTLTQLRLEIVAGICFNFICISVSPEMIVPD